MSCVGPKCEREAKYGKLGLCEGHYQQHKRGVPLSPLRRYGREGCAFPGCARPHEAHGYCEAHERQRTAGRALRPLHANEVHSTGSEIRIDLYDRQGRVTAQTMIDAGDAARVRPFRWTRTAEGYVRTRVGTKRVSLHRFLLDAPENLQVDHINGDRLDNRRCNLRLVTFAQQMQNKKPWSATGHRNVYFEEHKGLYRVIVVRYGVKHPGGRHKRLEDAIEAAKALRARLFTHHVEDRCVVAP